MPPEKDLRQADYFGNRLAKRRRQLSRWARSSGLDCFRLFDNDIPEVPLAVDAYGPCLHMALYERPYDKDEAEEEAWLALMRGTAAARLSIPLQDVYVKRRKRQRGLGQYGAVSAEGREIVVREQGLAFIVNLSDYLDTGLFLDHRPLRAEVRSIAAGKRVLNLFAYTGSFSVYAAAGGAASVTSVDLSSTYLDWAKRNFSLNGIDPEAHAFIREDALPWLAKAAARGEAYDIVILDPPTFSNSKRMDGDLDLSRDQARLIESSLALLSGGGVLYFSTNARRFKLDEGSLRGAQAIDASERSIPPDFRDRKIHRAWEIRKA